MDFQDTKKGQTQLRTFASLESIISKTRGIRWFPLDGAFADLGYRVENAVSEPIPCITIYQQSFVFFRIGGELFNSWRGA